MTPEAVAAIVAILTGPTGTAALAVFLGWAVWTGRWVSRAAHDEIVTLIQRDNDRLIARMQSDIDKLTDTARELRGLVAISTNASAQLASTLKDAQQPQPRLGSPELR